MKNCCEYRVVMDRWQDALGDDTYTIRWVEYDDEGRVKCYSASGHEPWGQSLEQIVKDFDSMMEAFMKPVLRENLKLNTLVPMEKER